MNSPEITPASIARTHVPGIIGAVARKFKLRIEDLSLLAETSITLNDQPGRYGFFVRHNDGTEYNVLGEKDPASGSFRITNCGKAARNLVFGDSKVDTNVVQEIGGIRLNPSTTPSPLAKGEGGTFRC